MNTKTVIFRGGKQKNFDLDIPEEKEIFERFNKEFNDSFDPTSPRYHDETSKVDGIVNY